jgi:hypothetical protein
MTLSAPIVVYEGTMDIYPPSNVCNVTLHDNDGDSASIPLTSEEPVELMISPDNATDRAEVLTLTLTDLPGLATISRPLGFDVRVDGDAPAYTKVVPEPDDWQSSTTMMVSITADDTNTSGVNGSTLEYQKSDDGIDNYGPWTRTGLETTSDGPLVNGLVILSFSEGDDNYIRWRAKDLVGNGHSISDDLQIRVDTNNVTFSDAFPSDWQTSLEVVCGIHIHDVDGSGIDVSTVQYRLSLNNLSEYTYWRDWDEEGMLDAKTIDTEVTAQMEETRYNFIQWRAMDIAGNGYTSSPHLRVMVDITPVWFSDLTPGEEVYQTRYRVECSAIAYDERGGSGIDPSSLEFRVWLNDGAHSPWSPIDAESGPFALPFSISVELPEGTDNRVQFRGSDLAGNGPTLSEEFILMVDPTPPSIELKDPVPSLRLVEGSVRLIVSVSDNTSGVDPSTIQARYRPPGAEEWTEWYQMEWTHKATTFEAERMLEFQPGDGNLVQVRAFDNASNMGVTDVFSYWVNRPPQAILLSPANGSSFHDEELVLFSSTGSSDPDGDAIEIHWSLQDGSELGFDGPKIERRLEPGTYVVVLSVVDEYGALDTVTITIDVHTLKKSSWMDDWFWLLAFILVVISVLCVALRMVISQRSVSERDSG